MRVMMIVKTTGQTEDAMLRDPEARLAAMGKYNEELEKAGVLVDLSGLKPSSAGTRVRFADGKRTVIDGPFTESKELIAGYWILQVESKEAAIEWARRIPAEVCEIAEVELRPYYELEELGPGPAVEAAKALAKRLPAKASRKR